VWFLSFLVDVVVVGALGCFVTNKQKRRVSKIELGNRSRGTHIFFWGVKEGGG